ncbi:hypothetical protein POSPLADRAFT_1032304 [Postia placenta MAD-698-R-SB12]|uniref:Uncharacterized protein n=1 Tax=Postia placenta MAD-698-R-SB12 TaxID=670580 RepID=A0A1X6NAH7_9APHY|nr:hypothetical protein POSPLADRAFT_1032304 [Postia placenta MAD-698-R-SB12]OSX65611.1 hypothetical protein POSPLADRAFT_1032304 [Postia placenta MAD-698-R-SB12]
MRGQILSRFRLSRRHRVTTLSRATRVSVRCHTGFDAAGGRVGVDDAQARVCEQSPAVEFAVPGAAHLAPSVRPGKGPGRYSHYCRTGRQTAVPDAGANGNVLPFGRSHMGAHSSRLTANPKGPHGNVYDDTSPSRSPRCKGGLHCDR